MAKRHPKVGERDRRHRTFLGWKVRVTYTNGCKQELSTDGHWYSSAMPWTDNEAAKRSVEQENRFAERLRDGRFAELVPVYRRESRTRRALRELVEAVEAWQPGAVAGRGGGVREGWEGDFGGDEMKVDWSSMSAADVYEALKSAPKCAGPWIEEDQRIGVARRETTYGDTIAVDTGDPMFGVYLHPMRSEPFSTRGEADACLRELGWLLVDEPTEAT